MAKWYGISVKPGDVFSAKLWRFEDYDSAKKWLKKTEYDFREREISDDPEYFWEEYADYLPARDEVEDLDDIANDYMRYTVFWCGGQRDGETLFESPSDDEAISFAWDFNKKHEGEFDPDICSIGIVDNLTREPVLNW